MDERGIMDVLTDRPTCQDSQTVKNEENTDGMAWRTKKFRTMTFVTEWLGEQRSSER